MASGTLYFGTTQYGAQYAVDYSYTGSTFTIDSVKVKLAQYVSTWWAFNLTVKINNTTVGGSGGNKFIDTFDWYDLGISGSASASGEVTISLTGSAIHDIYQFNVASPTSQTVNTGSSSSGGGSEGGNTSGGGNPFDDVYYLRVKVEEGVSVTVYQNRFDEDSDEYGYTDITDKRYEHSEDGSLWHEYYIYEYESYQFRFDIKALDGYTIDTVTIEGMEYDEQFECYYFRPYMYNGYALLLPTATKVDSSGDSGGSSSGGGIFIGDGTNLVKYRGYIDNGTSWDLIGSVLKNIGTCTTDNNGSATVNCGFKPDLVYIYVSTQTGGDVGAMESGFCAPFSEMSTNYNMLGCCIGPNDTGLAECLFTQTETGFTVSVISMGYNWNPVFVTNTQFDYKAIKYT